MINHPSLAGPLGQVGDAAVSATLSGSNGGPAPAGEIAAVAALLQYGIPDIANQWSLLLSPHGYSAFFTGVFCHAAPRVQFIDSNGRSGQCELADLLIVVDDLTGSSSTPADRRACLIQAKLEAAGGAISTSGTGSTRQLSLYSNWHAFTFVSTMYVQTQLDITTSQTPGNSGDSGRYGGISLSSSLWNQLLPSSNMNMFSGTNLGSFLAGMTLGQAGCGREVHPGQSDHWSVTIDELLRVTANQTINQSSLPWAHGQPKQTTALALKGGFSQVLMVDQPPGGGAPATPERSPERGVSVLHVALTRKP